MFKNIAVLTCIFVIVFHPVFSWSDDIYNYTDDKPFLHVQLNLEEIKAELIKSEVKIPEFLKPWMEKTDGLNKIHLLGSEAENVVYSMFYILEGSIKSQAIHSFVNQIFPVKIKFLDYNSDLKKIASGAAGMISCIVKIPDTEYHLFGMFNALHKSLESLKSKKKVKPIFSGFEKKLNDASILFVMNKSKNGAGFLKLIPGIDKKIMGEVFSNIEKFAFALQDNKIGMMLIMDSVKSTDLAENSIKEYQKLMKKFAVKQIEELSDEKFKDNLNMQKLKLQTNLMYMLAKNMKIKKNSKNKILSIRISPEEKIIPWIVDSIAKFPKAPQKQQGNMADYFEGKRDEARLKACKSNMLTIEGATELFYLDNSDYKGEITMELLVKNGALRTIPVCPTGAGYTSMRDEKGQIFVKCAKHGRLYDILMSGREEAKSKLPEKFKEPGKYCLDNMRTLEAATELFLLENPGKMHTINNLVKDGYLKAPPLCLEGGRYDISVYKGKISVSCSVHKGIEKLWKRYNK